MRFCRNLCWLLWLSILCLFLLFFQFFDRLLSFDCCPYFWRQVCQFLTTKTRHIHCWLSIHVGLLTTRAKSRSTRLLLSIIWFWLIVWKTCTPIYFLSRSIQVCPKSSRDWFWQLEFILISILCSWLSALCLNTTLSMHLIEIINSLFPLWQSFISVTIKIRVLCYVFVNISTRPLNCYQSLSWHVTKLIFDWNISKRILVILATSCSTWERWSA